MWLSPFMPQLSKCQSPNLFSKVWLAMQRLHTAQFLNLGEASTNQKWASWAWVLCLQWWKNLWNLHWWKKYFPHCFFPHDICYHQAPLCTASPPWDEKAPFTSAVATSSLSLNHLLTSRSFQISGKRIFSLASSLSSLPLLLHDGCSCTLKFQGASLCKKYSSKYKGRCFPGDCNKKCGHFKED